MFLLRQVFIVPPKIADGMLMLPLGIELQVFLTHIVIIRCPEASPGRTCFFLLPKQETWAAVLEH